MKATHALELIESQGVDSLREFLKRQRPTAGKRVTPSQRAFLQDPDVVEVERQLAALTVEHPKIAKTAEIVREELHQKPSARVIVFAQYRDTVDRLVEELRGLGDPDLRPARFVGQATHGDDVGLNQKEQVRILDSFRSGAINCLVATSVAEEGLDIPATDLVVFYEPVPDVIRTIQRRGRTGRARTGRVLVLVAEGTRDEGLNRAASSRERRMHTLLEQVEHDAQTGAGLPPPPKRAVQHTL
jgi:Fanconi anemia group M protein